MQMRTPLSIRMAERNSAMERIILDAEAGQVSAELVRRGIADARVHVLVEVQGAEELSTAAIAHAGVPSTGLRTSLSSTPPLTWYSERASVSSLKRSYIPQYR